MLLKALVEKKDEIYRVVKNNNGKKVKVFGSTVSGNVTSKSDVDFLVKFNEDASLFDLVEIKLELEELLNTKVDVVSEDGLKDNPVGKHIKRSAVKI
jgi:predicted nucleotidyltransferase